MVLILHIVIALSSVAYTTYLFFAPSKSKLRVSYSLVAATLVTGTFLVVANPSKMVSSCISGLIYIGAISLGLVAVQMKLASSQIDN